MKHYTSVFNSLVAVMMLLLSCGLTACGDDDDEPQAPDTWSTAYSVKVTFSDDYLKVADITAHVAYPDGTVQDVPVKDATFTLTMKGTSIPDKAGVAFTFVPKQEIAEGIYSLGVDGSIKAASYKNGEENSMQISTTSSKKSIKSDQMAEYLTKRGVMLAMGVNSDGKVIKLDSDDIDFGLNGVWEWLAGILN